MNRSHRTATASDSTAFLKEVGFHAVVADWFAAAFDRPSPPQLQGWPAIARGQHTLILAPTGSGKTLAAFLWSIDRLFRSSLADDEKSFEKNKPGIHTLYISPLKALNNDIHNNLQVPLKGIRQLAESSGIESPAIRTAVRTGDTPSHVRQSMLRKPPHILITTPESLYLLLTSEKWREMFRKLEYIIVDEIHAIAGNKRGVHLSLSLERLMRLCDKEPVRIGLSATQKPLEKIAAFLGGQILEPGNGRTIPRPVEIVDCGQRKKMDIGVISPTPDFGNLPDGSVWPQVIDKVYDLIRRHRTTLVFVNMRAQAEKIARQLNEKYRRETGDPDARLVLAHHGSISREMRYHIEAQLKAGKIPGVIATASLEMGIDIGSIDLVVQLETPKTVSAALQRVGRSGHLLQSTSKGRIIPLYQSDLDDAAAICRAMLQGDIEETHIPENCLDVLSQQIVAEVAMQDWDRHELFDLFRKSYCYRHLTETAFNQVVEMLAGRYADAELRALQPRLTWDRVNDKLIARRGSRLTAVMNGGTIADRGYYAVYLQDGNTRLGEVEEEFVFESRVGDVFFLGNNEWQIREISRDRILVTPFGSPKPRPPFWKGDPYFREFGTSNKIGRFREELVERMEEGEADQWLQTASHADEAITANLLNYLARQKEHTAHVPTSHKVTVEFFRDTVEEPQIVVHAPFGGTVNGAWCLALVALLENRYRLQVQYSYNDDGLIIRLMDVTDPPPLESLFALSSAEMEQLFIQSVGNTPLFTILFRHNATRALLLQRSRTGKRIPLWLQRLRAADLLQAVQDHRDFPVLLETYRECLEDVFDLGNFKKIIDKIKRGDISLHFVETAVPSPMASDLLFRFMAEHLYEEDRLRTAGQAAQVSTELLMEILSRQEIPAIVTRSMAAEFEKQWQYLTPEKKARNEEELYNIIAALGPIGADELTQRAHEEIEPWLDQLGNEKRIAKLDKKLVTADMKSLYEPPLDESQMSRQVMRLLRHRGPVTQKEISASLNIDEATLEPVFEKLIKEQELVAGKLLLDDTNHYLCDRHNFAILYRAAVIRKRQHAEPADSHRYYRFNFRWHGIGRSTVSVFDLVSRYAGLYFPMHVFEREILSSRLPSRDPAHHPVKELHEAIQTGQILPLARKAEELSRIKITLLPRKNGSLFFTREQFENKVAGLDENQKRVLDFLRQNGASPFRDIVDGTGLSSAAVEESLAELALGSLASCDSYPTFLRFIQPGKSRAQDNKENSWHSSIKSSWSVGHGRRGPWKAGRQKMKEKVLRHRGNWFVSSSFAVLGREKSKEEQAEAQARLLLNRYGIVVKEFYRREEGLLPWFKIFQALKRMEWSGEIRRGYFVKGLSGLQFALPEAVEMLEETAPDSGAETVFLSTIDPSLPFGGNINWGIRDALGREVTITRSASNHLLFVDALPVFYSENFGSRLWSCSGFEREHVVLLIEQLKNLLRLPAGIRPRKKLEILQFDGIEAGSHQQAPVFTREGFEKAQDRLVLWPSAVEKD